MREGKGIENSSYSPSIKVRMVYAFVGQLLNVRWTYIVFSSRTFSYLASLKAAFYTSAYKGCSRNTNNEQSRVYFQIIFIYPFESNSTMKLLHVFLVAVLSISGSLGDTLKCTLQPADVPKLWLDMVKPCTEILESQVKTEIEAAMTYLAMGAHFARDTVNRPGFSKFFIESANEEREHAIKIIEYLLMRGQLTNDVSRLLKFPVKPKRDNWSSGLEALTNALDLEASVTRHIRNIIIKCEKPDNINFNDYHLVDYLTGDFLDEQYKGQRDLAGKISTLGKMMKTHGALGEFLFDKKLLNGEL